MPSRHISMKCEFVDDAIQTVFTTNTKICSVAQHLHLTDIHNLFQGTN